MNLITCLLGAATPTTAASDSHSEPDALQVVRVSDYSEFVALRDAWNQLAEDRSLFLRHEWFDAAWQWRRLEQGTQLSLRRVYRGARLIGICPLIARSQAQGPMALRTLEFLTVPDNQLCDIIASDADKRSVAKILAAHFFETASEWDVMRLRYLHDHSVVKGELARALEERGMRQCLAPAGCNAYIALDRTWDDFYMTRSRRLKKANNLNANRLQKAGALRIDWLQPGVSQAADTALEAAIGISACSWKHTTGTTLDNPGPQAFIRRISQSALQNGWLSLWLLAVDDRPMAMEYQLVFGGAVHALRADYVDGCKDISPGSYLNRHQLEQLFGRGLRRYLMGPGDNPYKKHWSEAAEPQFELAAYSMSLRGRSAAFWALQIKPALRALKAKIGRSKEVGAG